MTHISPFESIRKVRNLIQRGDIWTQEIILAVTSEEIIIKDGTTRVGNFTVASFPGLSPRHIAYRNEASFTV